jgi:hypothetical protein
MIEHSKSHAVTDNGLMPDMPAGPLVTARPDGAPCLVVVNSSLLW